MSPRSAASVALAAVLVSSSLGCMGGFDEGPSGVDGPRRPSTGPGDLAGARVRRLTEDEYARTVRALVGDGATIDFADESYVNGYDNHADQLIVGGVLADGLFRNVPELAARAATNALAAPSCAPTGPTDEACARELLTGIATRAYRRPVEAVEVDNLIVVFRAGTEAGDFTSGLSLALQVVLQSAGLLYHTELGVGGPGPDAVTLTAYETAEAIAYALTGSPPDDALAADAASGAILSPDVRAMHAERLLTGRASEELLGDFAVRWLEVTNVRSLGRAAPEWNGVRDAAYAESRAFFAHAIEDENATLAQLFTSPTTEGDDALAAFYGGTRDASGRITAPAGERFGVLSQASVLARHSLTADSAPVHRGALVRRRLLCQALEGPPPGLLIMPPPEDPTLTTRQRWTALTAENPTCWACHQQLDTIGYGFEHYDAIGRFRALDRDQPVDSTATMSGTDVDGSFDDLGGIAEALAQSRSARSCFARNWVEFSIGRNVERGTVETVAADFVAGDQSVRELMIAIIGSDAFVRRTGS